jgi:predicted ABC-type ATPase
MASSRNRKRSSRRNSQPLCVVIAGPNGAGKTTFARRYLPSIVQIENFINADLIAAGLSPLAPRSAALRAGRLVLQEMDRLTRLRESFAFESTLSGRGYLARLKRLKRRGYRVEIVFLRVATPQLALRRIAARVRQGGHDVPKADVLRRFHRGWVNFIKIYQGLADAWVVYENSGKIALEVESGGASSNE